jgi:hypothetical protein
MVVHLLERKLCVITCHDFSVVLEHRGFIILDFKLSPCFKCIVFFWVIPRYLSSSSRRFGILYLFHLHRQVMKYDWGWGVWCIYTWEGCGRKVAEPMVRASAQTGRVDVPTGCGRGRYTSACAGGITVVYSVAVSFPWVCVAVVSRICWGWIPISVDVIWMHLNLNGFSDEVIHVAGFCREEFGFL